MVVVPAGNSPAALQVGDFDNDGNLDLLFLNRQDHTIGFVPGHPPLLLDLEAERDTDHVIAVFRERGHWGAIAASNYATCRYREPIHRTLRELALSYFDGYYNLAGERSLRTFSRPVDLSRFDSRRWMTSDEEVWFIAEHLCELPHTRLLPPALAKRLHRHDARGIAAGLVGHATRIDPRPSLPWPRGFRPR